MKLKHTNYYLIIGIVILLFPVLLAIIGPWITLRDPIQGNLIVKNPTTGEFLKSPIPPLTISLFPLGTDQYGRDILSRLLWAIRPTMILALVVATVRIIIGLLIGIFTGWSDGKISQLIDIIISGSLAVPILLVALCVTAALGPKLGTWAFILGLSITGWADVAFMVREQTRLIKQQPFIETSIVLGSNNLETIGRHLIPSVMSMVWTFMAYEISNTLFIVAALGFLGYYINSIWIPSGEYDFVRASGQPELGEMLSSIVREPTAPWPALIGGGVFFVIILGFNMIGEGLRRVLDLTLGFRQRTTGLFDIILEQREELIGKLKSGSSYPWRRNLSVFTTFGVLVIILVFGGYFLWESQRGSTGYNYVINIPGSQQWATQLHDSSGTLWANTSGPMRESKNVWDYNNPSGYTGGPAISSDGIVYITSNDSLLQAIKPDGSLLWKLSLPSEPFGSPAIGPYGNIYIADKHGKIMAISPNMELLWIKPDSDSKYSSISSPVISKDEAIFYATEIDLVSISKTGELLWEIPQPTFGYFFASPRLTVDDKYILFEGFLINAKTGNIEYRSPKDVAGRYVVGTEGNIFLYNQSTVKKFLLNGNSADIKKYASWDPLIINTGSRIARDVGVTPDGHIWMYFSTGSDYVKIVWFDPDGNYISSIDYPYHGGWEVETTQLIAISKDNVAYLCGMIDQTPEFLECRANTINSNTPLWKIRFPGGQYPAGGALVTTGRLYVSTTNGNLYAIEENK